MVTDENSSFKASARTLRWHEYTRMNRQELEDYVIDLYYNQKKTFMD
jgi:hypothetical protein